MSADKHRGIRRARQKRARDDKKAQRRVQRLAPFTATAPATSAAPAPVTAAAEPASS
jgi:hypothetical protein